MKLIRNPILRHTVFGFGVLFVVLGVVGVFVPLWPTTPFLIVAGWCFFRSSPKAYQWLRARPYLGPALVDWETKGAIAVPIKLLALTTIVFSLGLMWYMVDILWLRLSITLCLAAASVFILTRPSH
jgi:uncharacterized membrane protein YbaN (DUF454 family)